MDAAMVRSDDIRIRLTTAAFALLVSACGGAGSESSTDAVVRDSAGITIAESDAPVWAEGQAWTIADAPSVRIGTLDGPPETQLYDVIGAARLTDGTIVLANAGTQELRVYDANAEHVRSVGGEGDGPGEFRRPTSFHRLDEDSLLVFDAGLNRLSVFDPDGRFVRSFTLETDGESTARLVVPLSGGRLVGSVARRMGAGAMRSGVPEIVHDAFVYSMDGIVLDTIGDFRGSEGYIWVDDSGITVFSASAYPFGRSAVHARHGALYFSGWTERYEVRVYDAGGELDRIIRRAHEDRPVADADLERARAELVGITDDPNARRHRERIFDGMELNETFPAFETFVVDSDGHLWVERARDPGDEIGAAGWDVFDSGGRWLGVVRLPVGLDVYEIGRDYVLGRMRDDLDVERVVVFPLDRSDG